MTGGVWAAGVSLPTPSSSASLLPSLLLSPEAWKAPSLAGGGLLQPCFGRAGSCPRLTWVSKAEEGVGGSRLYQSQGLHSDWV